MPAGAGAKAALALTQCQPTPGPGLSLSSQIHSPSLKLNPGPQERKEPQEKAAEEAQLAAWSAALPELYPDIAGERMVSHWFPLTNIGLGLGLGLGY